MSQVQQLKQAVAQIGSSAERTAGGLAQFDQQFSRQAGAIQSALTGSSQRKDQEMLRSIDEARRKVHDAAAALQQVSRVAKQYGSSI